MMHKYLRLFALSLIIIFIPVNAKYFGINVFQPWNINLRPDRWPQEPWQFSLYFEEGLKEKGYNADNDVVDVMQIWTPKQDALAMLQGFPADAPETLFYENVLMSPEDDGIRGNLTVTGDFDLRAAGGFALRYNFANCVTLGAYLPFYSMRLKKVNFKDDTLGTSGDDLLIRDNLTNNFVQNVKQFDGALNLTGWDRTGVGDLAFTAEWLGYFPQMKPYLKEVGVNSRIGLTVPTGLRENINDILSIPYGFDGSVGLFFNAGIICNWFYRLRGGVDFLFLTLFGDQRERRIKIQENQTDFLFLAKAKVHTDYGFTQRYNLFLEAFRVWKGLSFGAAFQWWRHAEDKLTLCTDDYSTALANSAENLQEWNLGQIIFKINYDFQCDIDQCQFFKPQLLFFYKIPVTGKRAIMLNTIGLQCTFNF